MKITKAIIAAAGLGTRFLPATKAVPKEMLPLLDRPILQHVVEEAVNSGITDIILVIRRGSHAITDHFDSAPELEQTLEATGKLHYLEEVRRVSQLANFAFVRQGTDLPYGNGSPLLAASPFISRDIGLNWIGKVLEKELSPVYRAEPVLSLRHELSRTLVEGVH